MTLSETLAALEAAGSEQRRAIYARHGVGPEQYGVSTADLKALARRIGRDDALAEALWTTVNHDARMLALAVADPRTADADRLGAWMDDVDNYVLGDALSTFIARTGLARDRAVAWIDTDGEWTGQVGWNLIAHLALKDAELPDAFFLSYVERIERDVHQARNRVRHAMNNALIAVGVRNDALERRALEAAGRIGTVEVDHGQTGCVTPDAAAYIRKTRARKK